ncbi:hypothetical protein ODJ79_10170 [Actinoplanes sp. KI2]|uniref:hypothetical protein n=1 Tax=Actinoplanes sp. KI2 TaxID=2983315 RepID=UPI0021D5E465|nr:hypothetical protein [Actinoplanes sp. KI2]MCU7724080.1 hypothetical protein [Actinoplanes sp. KI2]
MRTELSDLLHEAAQDPPPPRYGVDDAVRAGKRRLRRRRAGWMAGAALAVAVAVTVPQLVTRPARHAPTPAASTPSPSKTAEINFTFSGYPAGRFTVSGPFRWTLAGMSAPVWKNGGDPASPEGILTVYHPGVADPLVAAKGVKRTATAAIGGRPAYLATDPDAPMLVWQYADDAYAIVAAAATDSGGYAMTKAEMRQVAVAFQLGSVSPVRVPFRTAVAPAGYRLVETQWDYANDGPSAMVRLLPASVATPQISDVDHGPEPDPRSPYADQLRIEVVTPTAGEFGGKSSGGTHCPDDGRCYRWLPGGKYVVEAICRAVGKDYLTRLVDDLEIADPGDRATWFTANRAFPASALVRGE